MTNEGTPTSAVDSDAQEASDNVEAGEWGVFVSRAVQGIRRELGEQAANRVATFLHDQKSEAIDATRDQLVATQAMLERTLGEVAEARRSHERLQADLARMEAGVRDAKMEAARIRSEATDLATRRKADFDVAAGVEAASLAGAWDEVRNQESEVAQRRSELLDLDEHANARLEEVKAAGVELDAMKTAVENDRAEVARLVDDSISAIDQAKLVQVAKDVEVESVLDLRGEAVDLRETGLNDRQTELDEWEADLVDRARGLEARIVAMTPTRPPAGSNVAGWGRRDRG
ncbi:MAG: hypothetical protein ACI9C1_001895 [Candidatus Aldehydirespiratoraceae bacterium]|jgi:hypothetical protein